MNINIPNKVRAIAYVVFATLAAGQGATYSAYRAIHQDPPTALVAGSAAFVSLTTAPFVVAVLNISKSDKNLQVAGFDPLSAPVDTDEAEEPDVSTSTETVTDDEDNNDNSDG